MKPPGATSCEFCQPYSRKLPVGHGVPVGLFWASVVFAVVNTEAADSATPFKKPMVGVKNSSSVSYRRQASMQKSDWEGQPRQLVKTEQRCLN